MQDLTPNIVCLAGDGIGPEVMSQARRALEALVSLDVVELPFGAAAIRSHGDPLPPETLAACRDADAILKAPVGDPEFDGAEVRPEQGIIRLRQELDVYANLRPAARGAVDLVIVRELVGGLYYGARGVREDGTVFDTLEYHPREVERIAVRAFELARTRRGHVTSVDKANVLDTSRMWRRVATEIASGYPEIQLEHMLADNAAMQLVERPERFDVMVMENTFGDILSDLAAAVTGGLGLAPSASLGDSGPGIFEPVHGSAPDIAGQGIANPTAMLRTTALMLELGLDQPEAGRRLVAAVEMALAVAPTADLGGTATTTEFGDAVLEAIEAA